MKKFSLSIICLMVCMLLPTTLLSGCGAGSSTKDRRESYSAGAYAEEAIADSYVGDYMTDDIYEADFGNGAVEESAMEAPAEMKSSSGTTQAETVTDNSRKLVKTVNMNVETDSFDELIATIDNKIAALNGYAESKDIGGRSFNDVTSDRYANITVRIPTSKLNEFVTLIEGSSNITSKNEYVEDVTLQYVDMESHIESLRIEQERLNELLLQAEDIETIIVLEDRLTEVRYQLESYESQLRTMQNKVDYSTIYLYISEVTKYTPEPEYKRTAWERISTGFVESLSDVGEGIVDFFVGLIVNFPYIVMFVIVVAVIAGIVTLVVRFFVKRSKTKEYRLQKKYEKQLEKLNKKNAAKGGDTKES